MNSTKINIWDLPEDLVYVDLNPDFKRKMLISAKKSRNWKELSKTLNITYTNLHGILYENEKIIKEFEQTIKPYQLAIKEIVNQTKTLNKIEMKNYDDSLKIVEIFKANIPPEFWLYILERQIKFIFSNKAYSKFCEKIKNELSKDKIKPITYPDLLSCSYENLLKYKDKYLK